MRARLASSTLLAFAVLAAQQGCSAPTPEAAKPGSTQPAAQEGSTPEAAKAEPKQEATAAADRHPAQKDPSEGMSAEEIAKRSTYIDCGMDLSGVGELDAPIVFFGTIPGTDQGPRLVAKAACQRMQLKKGGRILVGLDVWSANQQQIVDFIHSDGGMDNFGKILEHNFWTRERQDGRSSVGTIALINDIRRYREKGLPFMVEAIACEQQDEGEARSKCMAKNLKAAIARHKPDQVLVLTDRVQANPRPKEGVSLASLMKAENPATIGLGWLQPEGTAWNCESDDGTCGARDVGEAGVGGQVPRLELSAAGENGFDGQAVVDKTVPAPPAYDQWKRMGGK